MNFEIAPKETEIQANWYDAKLYCFSLTIDGKSSWRLPTKIELNEICKSENDFETAWYWSATEHKTEQAFAQYFGAGAGYKASISKPVNIDYVRAVRTLS